METFKRTWAEIDLSALKENYQTVRRRVGPQMRVMAVVKADAYGHGAKRVAPFLEQCGADFFGVACLQEAVALREYGITRPILILGYTATRDFPVLLQYDLSQTVYDFGMAEQLSAVGGPARVHIALDTGMGRIGFDAFDPAAAAGEILRVAALPDIRVEGLFTHFSVADVDGEEAYTQEQYRRFDAVRALLAEEGLHPICHAANSAGTFLNENYWFDMVRAGIMLYGLEPGGRTNPYRPVMTVKTTVAAVRNLPAGRDISYGRRYTTTAPMRVATLAAGYADGYPRRLSGQSAVLINGKSAPILGTVCMDQMMVDVTDIPCNVGDEAVLMGGGVPFDSLAAKLGTIHYELVCGISPRVQRIYLNNK